MNTRNIIRKAIYNFLVQVLGASNAKECIIRVKSIRDEPAIPEPLVNRFYDWLDVQLGQGILNRPASTRGRPKSLGSCAPLSETPLHSSESGPILEKLPAKEVATDTFAYINHETWCTWVDVIKQKYRQFVAKESAWTVFAADFLGRHGIVGGIALPCMSGSQRFKYLGIPPELQQPFLAEFESAFSSTRSWIYTSTKDDLLILPVYRSWPTLSSAQLQYAESLGLVPWKDIVAEATGSLFDGASDFSPLTISHIYYSIQKYMFTFKCSPKEVKGMACGHYIPRRLVSECKVWLRSTNGYTGSLSEFLLQSLTPNNSHAHSTENAIAEDEDEDEDGDAPRDQVAPGTYSSDSKTATAAGTKQDLALQRLASRTSTQSPDDSTDMRSSLPTAGHGAIQTECVGPSHDSDMEEMDTAVESTPLPLASPHGISRNGAISPTDTPLSYEVQTPKRATDSPVVNESTVGSKSKKKKRTRNAAHSRTSLDHKETPQFVPVDVGVSVVAPTQAAKISNVSALTAPTTPKLTIYSNTPAYPASWSPSGSTPSKKPSPAVRKLKPSVNINSLPVSQGSSELVSATPDTTSAAVVDDSIYEVASAIPTTIKIKGVDVGVTRYNHVLRSMVPNYNTLPKDKRVEMKRAVKVFLADQLGGEFDACVIHTLREGHTSGSHHTYGVPASIESEFRGWAAKTMTRVFGSWLQV
ncbi:hypothetical protein BASA60_008925 [Batrachochytrium salamandrivorans]|nr:hypothetical protein BASA60_008925 [Batrachochytrium salamandrivorans]